MTRQTPLKKETFRRFDEAKFGFTCAVCGERCPAGGIVYWKREAVGFNEFKTTTVCPQCFAKS